MYLGYVEGFLTALAPASQALWDQEFTDAVAEATEGGAEAAGVG